MYCPKCSQQQPSEGMRFCSRCGFTLNGIALVLENNGIIPQVVPELPRMVRPSRNRIMIESALLSVSSFTVAFVATFWFSAHGRGELIAELIALLFVVLGLIGLLRFLYGFLFAKDVGKAASSVAQNQVSSGESFRGALPPQQSIPISDYPLRVNTKEMSPRSVTENTTRLLEEQPPAGKE
ncbi:MAG: Zinc-ribbon domain protein [Acidobacteria bacterium]|nr:Zinc-ribbon domain protein [Acidobacteriota bacterium]